MRGLYGGLAAAALDRTQQGAVAIERRDGVARARQVEADPPSARAHLQDPLRLRPRELPPQCQVRLVAAALQLVPHEPRGGLARQRRRHAGAGCRAHDHACASPRLTSSSRKDSIAV